MDLAVLDDGMIPYFVNQASICLRIVLVFKCLIPSKSESIGLTLGANHFTFNMTIFFGLIMVFRNWFHVLSSEEQ